MLVWNSGNDGLCCSGVGLECCPKTTQGISSHVVFYFLLVGSRACCHCRVTNHKGRGSGSTKPKLPSFLSAFSTLKLPWRSGRWGCRCCRANTPTLLRCSPGSPLLSAHLLFLTSCCSSKSPLPQPGPWRAEPEGARHGLKASPASSTS